MHRHIFIYHQILWNILIFRHSNCCEKCQFGRMFNVSLGNSNHFYFCAYNWNKIQNNQNVACRLVGPNFVCCILPEWIDTKLRLQIDSVHCVYTLFAFHKLSAQAQKVNNRNWKLRNIGAFKYVILHSNKTSFNCHKKENGTLFKA